MLLVMLAVPSLTGVMADRRLRRSFDTFNQFVYQAQERSMTERRPYLLVWTDKTIELRPEAELKGDDEGPAAVFKVNKGESFALSFTAALGKDPPLEWIFWPTGTCEPVDVNFSGRDGRWTARYSPLTARADLTAYVAR